jgi:PIN domain nuclease of toxin-antitoxin system
MIVLDSHVLVWARADERRLSAVARRAILGARAEGGLAVAAISLYEVARLFARGHVRAVGTVSQAVQDLVDSVTVLPLTPEIAALATSFPREFPRDPADRLITATARAHALPLVTADRAIRDSPLVETIW